MHRILSVIAIAAGAWTIFVGAWGLIESVFGSEPLVGDIVEGQGWIASALVTAGIAAVALALRAFGSRYR